MSDRVLTLFEDARGRIWIGTPGGGLLFRRRALGRLRRAGRAAVAADHLDRARSTARSGSAPRRACAIHRPDRVAARHPDRRTRRSGPRRRALLSLRTRRRATSRPRPGGLRYSWRARRRPLDGLVRRSRWRRSPTWPTGSHLFEARCLDRGAQRGPDARRGRASRSTPVSSTWSWWRPPSARSTPRSTSSTRPTPSTSAAPPGSVRDPQPLRPAAAGEGRAPFSPT